MTEREKLEEIWNGISHSSVSFLNKNYKYIYPLLLEFLIADTLDSQKFTINIYEDGWQKGALIGKYESNKHKQLELRTRKKESFDLVLLVSDSEEKQLTFKHKLSDDDIELIPKKLRRLMETVKELNRSMTFFNSTIN